MSDLQMLIIISIVGMIEPRGGFIVLFVFLLLRSFS